MAENVTIARPYADAAFELARGAGALGPWSEALDRLALVAADSGMTACFSDFCLIFYDQNSFMEHNILLWSVDFQVQKFFHFL